MKIEGSTLVAGGAAGTCLAITRALTVAWASVLVVGWDRTTSKAQSLMPRFTRFAADLADPDQRERLVALVSAGTRPSDILVNNPGTMHHFALTSLTSWRGSTGNLPSTCERPSISPPSCCRGFWIAPEAEGGTACFHAPAALADPSQPAAGGGPSAARGRGGPDGTP